MRLSKEKAIEIATVDLAKRVHAGVKDIAVSGVTEEEFPDSALGAPRSGEMAAQMISDGWKIVLSHGGRKYEYRADREQVRLKGFNGGNFVVFS